MQNNEQQHSGLIIAYPKAEDWFAGSESSICGAVEVMPSGDWTKYLPAGEDQWCPTFDTMSCTSFSYTNTVETYLNYLILEKKMSVGNMKWLSDNGYIGDDGKVNFSDRFLAIMSGTTIHGNQLNVVAETARKNGLIPQSMLPFGGNTWQEFMNPDVITHDMINMGQEFLKRFQLSYEWFMFNYDNVLDQSEQKKLMDSLKQLPVQVGIPFPASHAIELVSCQNDLIRLFDTYNPYIKDKIADQSNGGVMIHFAMRHIVTEIITIQAPVVDNNWTYTFTLKARKGDTGDHIIAIQKALFILGFFKGDYAPVFGPKTLSALMSYQKSVGLPATGYFGDLTMAKFNERFAVKKN